MVFGALIVIANAGLSYYAASPVVYTSHVVQPVVKTHYTAVPVVKHVVTPVIQTAYIATPVVHTVATPVVHSVQHSYASVPVVKSLTPAYIPLKKH